MSTLTGSLCRTFPRDTIGNLSILAAALDAAYAPVDAGRLIALHQNTAGGNKSTTSTTQADVDATNAVITFTAPASGKVLVRVTCTGNIDAAAQNGFLGLRESTTDIVTKTFAMQGLAAAGHDEQICWEAYLTGISAGSHTYKLAFAVNGGTTFTVRASATSPMILTVYAVA